VLAALQSSNGNSHTAQAASSASRTS
jgi:hypothetical protein